MHPREIEGTNLIDERRKTLLVMQLCDRKLFYEFHKCTRVVKDSWLWWERRWFVLLQKIKRGFLWSKKSYKLTQRRWTSSQMSFLTWNFKKSAVNDPEQWNETNDTLHKCMKCDLFCFDWNKAKRSMSFKKYFSLYLTRKIGSKLSSHLPIWQWKRLYHF